MKVTVNWFQARDGFVKDMVTPDAILNTKLPQVPKMSYISELYLQLALLPGQRNEMFQPVAFQKRADIALEPHC